MKYPINQIEVARIRLYNLIHVWQIVKDPKWWLGNNDNYQCYRSVGNEIIYCIAITEGKVPEYKF